MAPLKLEEQATPILLQAALPCLKRHGSIEADRADGLFRQSHGLPCLKRHGSIEALVIVWRRAAPLSLPCLKRHGSIEASWSRCSRSPGSLTMSEKTWLH